MSDNVLILHPMSALYRPDAPTRIIDWLEEEGMIRQGVVSQGEHPGGERRTFRTGAAFEKYVHFDEAQRARTTIAGFIRDVCQVVFVGSLEREWFIAGACTVGLRLAKHGSFCTLVHRAMAHPS